MLYCFMNLNIVKPNLPLRLSLYNTFKFHMKQAVVQGCSVKMLFLGISQNSQENTCARVSVLIKILAEACNFLKTEALAQVFSCEFCEISKKTSGGCLCIWVGIWKIYGSLKIDSKHQESNNPFPRIRFTKFSKPIPISLLFLTIAFIPQENQLSRWY